MTSTVIPAAGMAAEEKPITRVGAKKRMATDAIEDILYGSYIEYPFDTVKVRLQSQPDSLPLLYKGPLDCLQQSFRQDGFLGMYRGISAPLVGAALETSSLFLWEQAAQKFLRWSGLYKEEGPLPLQALFLTGALSGAATSLVLTPVELVKCKIQVPTITSSDGIVRPPPTVTGVIRSVFKHQGLLGFWNGQLGTLIRETGGCAAWFGAKETVTLLFRRYNAQNRPSIYDATKPLPLWQQAIAGAAAGTSYNFLFFPADTIKSRMQTSAVEGTRPGEVAVRKTFWKEGNALYKQHGLPGLYRGCGITVARSAPSSAFIFIIYDYLKTHFKLG